MKQAEDTYTPDLYGQMAPEVLYAIKGYRYRFYIETPDGVEIEWCGLTKKQARDMYAYTNAHHPCNVTRCGWELTK
jgi:hypothetical protein